MKRQNYIVVILYTITMLLIYNQNIHASIESTEYDLKEEFEIMYDISGNQRIVDEEYQQVGFHSNRIDADERKNISKEEANKMISIFADEVINVSEYTQEKIEYNEENQYYTITYYKYNNGYKTQDFCFVDMDTNGKIISYVAMNQGSFDNIDMTHINKEYIDLYLDSVIGGYDEEIFLGWEINDTIAILDNYNNPQMLV